MCLVTALDTDMAHDIISGPGCLCNGGAKTDSQGEMPRLVLSQ
jgi:uncharacterized membrane protein